MFLIQLLKAVVMGRTNVTSISRRLLRNAEDMKDLIFFYVPGSHREGMRASLNRLVGDALDQSIEEGMANFMSRFRNLNCSEFWMGDRSGAKEIETVLRRFVKRCGNNQFRIEKYIPLEFENCHKSIEQNLTKDVQPQYARQEPKMKDNLMLDAQRIGEQVVLLFRTKGEEAGDRIVW
jgi:hypothetical protein